MNIELPRPVENHIRALLATGLLGTTTEEVTRRLIEERVRQLLADGTIKRD